MKEKLSVILQKIEHNRYELIALCATIPEEKFQEQPALNKWSVAQILAHLITSEKLSLGYMKKKYNAINELPETGLGASLRLSLLTISQRLPIKYSAPKIVVNNTPEPGSFLQLKEDWDGVRKDLHDFLYKLEEKDFKKALYKHPFAGRLNVYQAISFLDEHINHHLPQIKRLIK